jgi:hypothetical protein
VRPIGATVLLSVWLATGCAGEPAPPAAATEPEALPRPVPLVRLAAAKLAHCRRSPLLRPTCPTLVPRVRATFLSHLARDLARPHPLDVFNLERGGEDPPRPELNRPPRMAHLVLIAGDVERAAAFAYPDDPRRPRDGLMRRPRTKAVDLGGVDWANRRGRLYLAPPHLHGGMLGNHLVFRWQTGATEYAVTLHAWEPLREAVATLRTVVGSTPG